MVYEYQALTRDQITQIVAGGKAIAVLPVGSTEQHGPHLPVGTDSYTSAYYVRESLGKVKGDADFLVLPHLFYSLSVEHISYPATIALSAETCLRVLSDIGRGLQRTGIQKLLIINGHGGNDHMLQVAAREIRALGIHVYCSSVIPLMDAMGVDPSAVHADKVETSIIMAIHPELVQRDQITPELDGSVDKWMRLSDFHSYVMETWFAEDVAVDGVIGAPTQASEEFGREWLAKLTDEMAKGADYIISR